MLRYKFCNDLYELTNEGHKIVEKKTIIMYKCLICHNFLREWDDTWNEEKKLEIKSEVNKHHNEHIIPDEPTLSE